MTTTTASDLQKNLNKYLRGIEKHPVVVTRGGKPVAVLIPRDEDTLYELSLANSPRFLEILAESQRQLEAGKHSTHEEFWRRVKDKNGRSFKGKRKKAAARR